MSSYAKVRWTNNEDLVVAETVLSHLRSGKTLLSAFKEASDKLTKRTPGAVAFRWNDELSEQYQQAVQLAKQQAPKNKSRDVAPEKQVEQQFKNMMDNLTSSKEAQMYKEEQEKEMKRDIEYLTKSREIQPIERQEINNNVEHSLKFQQSTQNNEITFTDVIDFIQKTEQENNELKSKVLLLEKQLEEANHEKANLQKELQESKNNTRVVSEDYKALIQIMERARDLAKK